jgi:hypothetical protein
MRAITLVGSLTILASACSYSHVATTSGTFNRVAQSGPLVLKISRHLDTVVRGPDSEEDQLLVLEVHDYQLNQRLPIPSDKVSAQFTVTRFGPRSIGENFTGFLIVRKVGTDQVDAHLHLNVTARTESGDYTQTAKFRGEYSFTYREPK